MLKLPYARSSRLFATAVVIAAASPAMAGGAPQTFAGCGTLGPGPQGCLLFTPSDGSPGFALLSAEVTGLGLFDTLYVSGTIQPDSLACFPALIPALIADVSAPCVEVVGTIGIGPQGCPILQTSTGEGFFLSDTDGHGFGETVFVRGGLIDDFLCAPVITAPGILVDTVGIGYVGCGTIQQIPSFITQEGPVFLDCPPQFVGDDGTVAVLETLGEFGPGDRVKVAGHFEQFPITIPECPAAAAIFDNTIVSAAGDINCDDVVDGLDLGVVLAQWTAAGGPLCGLTFCSADLNRDGVVDGLDLGIVLANWTIPAPR